MFDLMTWLGFVSHDITKYLLFAGFLYFGTHTLYRESRADRKIQNTLPNRHQITREISWSLLSAMIFATVSMFGVIGMADLELNKVYMEIDGYGWGYLAASLIIMIIAHDAYFYWMHRLMHFSSILRITHRIHHRSRSPTSWAAYCFDPIEATLQVMFVPLFVLFIPTHPIVLLIWSLHMVIRNVIGHCGFEIFPANMVRNPVFGWITTVTHHDLHHQNATCNYGLYFTWWDRLMGTEHPNYFSRFDVAAQRLKSGSASLN